MSSSSFYYWPVLWPQGSSFIYWATVSSVINIDNIFIYRLAVEITWDKMQINHTACCLTYTKLFISVSYYFKIEVEQFDFIRQQTASATNIISKVKARGYISPLYHLFILDGKRFPRNPARRCTLRFYWWE